MIHLVHARKAQSLVSEQEYRQLLHQYTALTDDVRLQCAKNAYKLQSEVTAKCPSSRFYREKVFDDWVEKGFQVGLVGQLVKISF